MCMTMNDVNDQAQPSLDVLFDSRWLDQVKHGLEPSVCTKFDNALAWSKARFLESGPSITGEYPAQHAAGVVMILTELQADGPSRMAALLAVASDDDSPSYARNKKDPISKTFGDEIGRLVQGYRALVRLGQMTRDSSDVSAGSGAQSESLRKMLLAMAADLRIVLMRLASRLQTLRWHVKTKTALNPALAHETLDLYAPLANRLGIWQLKWQMEDLAFRFLDPVKFKEIAGLLEEKRVEREAFINDAVASVEQAMATAGIEAEVSGRPKHIFSIWNKMRTKNLAFSELMDLRALRIIVPDIRACYNALGIVHTMWSPLPDEFDDYISRPKQNGYRSLHTVVADQDGRPFEVQIRTQEMHEFAEFGMAAHWRYKEAGAQGGQVSADSEYDRKLSWIRQLLAWKSDVQSASAEVTESIQTLDRNIYVLTPQARVVELSPGATPIDFAYHVHTDLGHRCRGAKVDGVMVPLNTKLKNGQTVEIIATKSGGPSRDWLNPQLGYLAGSRAKAKVRAWFNAIDVQERTSQGQAILEKELQRLGKTSVNLEHLAHQLGFSRIDDLYLALSKDEFSLRTLASLFDESPQEETDELELLTRRHAPASTAKSGVLVVGVDALLTMLAKCCRPAPPDAIVGFVTRGRGVSIHRQDCKSFQDLARKQAERVIDVEWGDTQDRVYPVDLHVEANDRAGLLRDISEVFARQRINVVGVNTQSKQGYAIMVFTAEVKDGQHLGRALAGISEVQGVLDVSRK